MKMRLFATTVCCFAVSIGMGAFYSQQSDERPTSTQVKVVEDVLNQHDVGFPEPFDNWAKTSSDVAPVLKALLEHPDKRMRERALYALTRLPNEAEKTLLMSLKSNDQYLRRDALRLAVPHLDNRDIAEAWVDTFARLQEPNEGSRQLVYDELRHSEAYERMREPLRAAILTHWKTNGLENMTIMVRVVAEICPRGDQEAIATLYAIEQFVRKNFVVDGENEYQRRLAQKQLEALEQAIQLAGAVLGDHQCLAECSQTLKKADRETKQRLYRWIERLAPTPETHKLLRQGLDDVAPFDVWLGDHRVPDESTVRACDIAARILLKWYPDAPLSDDGYLRMSDEKLEGWRAWVDGLLKADEERERRQPAANKPESDRQ